MSNVRRVYVEKKPDFAVKAKELKHEIKHYLGITTVEAVRVLIRYDVENISEETYKKALYTVFSEPPVDDIYEETFDYGDAKVFTVEFLPGQFDQRADSAVQCVQFIKEDELPVIKTATTYVIEGEISEEEMEAIKAHCINPVDSRETGLEKPETLVTKFEEPADVKIFDGFKDMPEAELKELYSSLGLAMTFKDFQHIQNYFKGEEHRDPSMTEIRVLDTYWSDHCRHTTFSTELTNIGFQDGFYRAPLEEAYYSYMDDFEEMYKDRDDKYVCLMDMALMAMKRLKKDGVLDNMEESDEINACSIVVPVEIVTGEEKRICLVSGIYGDELGGQYICGEIIRRIKAEFHNLTGIVDVYPAVNPLGLDARTRAVPISDIDYSSAFPGDINGGLEDYTAAKLLEDIKGASCCIDIHSSNIFLQEVPQVRLNDDYDEMLLHLAKYMNTDLVWIHPSQTVNEGSLAYALNQMGIPTMVTESGSAFRIRYEYCCQIIDGIFSVMAELGIWKGKTNGKTDVPFINEDKICYLNCEFSGLFVSYKRLKDRVKKGEIIGIIQNPLMGATEEEVIAPVDGILMTLREHPSVAEGSLVARVIGGGNL